MNHPTTRRRPKPGRAQPNAHADSFKSLLRRKTRPPFPFTGGLVKGIQEAGSTRMAQIQAEKITLIFGRTSERDYMKMLLQLLIVLPAVVWTSMAAASDTKVVINLSQQRACLVEQGRVTLISPVASGKPGWPTPTGNFRIFNKDVDHRLGASGRSWIVMEESSTQMQLLPARYPRVAIIEPRRCLTLWNSARWLGCTPVTFRVSRVPRVRADASRIRCAVF